MGTVRTPSYKRIQWSESVISMNTFVRPVEFNRCRAKFIKIRIWQGRILQNPSRAIARVYELASTCDFVLWGNLTFLNRGVSDQILS
jgi:hypothetical protein